MTVMAVEVATAIAMAAVAAASALLIRERRYGLRLGSS
jgi:hypothetical protein